MSQFPNKTILAATDFSEYSKTAINICLGVYRCMKTKLCILHTIERIPHKPRHLSSCTAPEDMKQKLEKETVDKIKAMIPEGIREKSDIIPMVRFGKPYNEILQVAKEENVDLLVIGTHGRAGVDRVLMGSVAEKIVRKAHCPVMVIKGKKYAGFKRIIVPVDFSDCSRRALEYAIATAGAHKSRLTVLHISEESFVEPYINAANSEEEADEIMKEIDQVTKTRYDEFLKTVDLGEVEHEKLLMKGVPETEIVEIAMEQQADLVVMGTYGRAGIKHILIGSTAEEVVRAVHCDIIILKPEKSSFSVS